MYQKEYADARHQDIEYAVDDKVLLSTKNLWLHETRNLGDRFVGPFVITEWIGSMAYHLSLSQCAALRGVHDVFHVSLLHGQLSNGIHADMPPIKIDGEAEYKVAEIKGHCEWLGEMQYLTEFVGFDSLDDMWLSTV